MSSTNEELTFDTVKQSPDLEAQLGPLRALVEHLHAKNIALEETEKVSQMLSEDNEKAILILETKCKTLEKEKGDAQRIIEETLNGANLSNKSFDELEIIEHKLRNALNIIILQEESIIKKKLSVEEEKMTCVICQIETKSVLLMPCRHMCVCKACSLRHEMDKCPLCRQTIKEKIDVYA